MSPRFTSFPSPSLSNRSGKRSPHFLTQPPPNTPPAWSWSCHHCQATYPLGATRRCLYDGHYFCAGTTLNKKTGRVKRHRACGSVFDYVGWREWGVWRRKEKREETKMALREGGKQRFVPLGDSDEDSDKEMYEGSDANEEGKGHDCERDCNFPSECRWRPKLAKEKEKEKEKKKKKKLGKRTPVKEEEENAQLAEVDSEPVSQPQGRSSRFNEELDTPMPDAQTSHSSSSSLLGDIGCRQITTSSTTANPPPPSSPDLPAPLRIRRKALKSSTSVSASPTSLAPTNNPGPLSSNPPSSFSLSYSTTPTIAITSTASDPSTTAPALPELNFPSIPVPDFSLFKATLDHAAPPPLSPRSFSGLGLPRPVLARAEHSLPIISTSQGHGSDLDLGASPGPSVSPRRYKRDSLTIPRTKGLRGKAPVSFLDLASSSSEEDDESPKAQNFSEDEEMMRRGRSSAERDHDIGLALTTDNRVVRTTSPVAGAVRTAWLPSGLAKVVEEEEEVESSPDSADSPGSPVLGRRRDGKEGDAGRRRAGEWRVEWEGW